ncbi:MAG: two-component sensor histidine kinase [Clostridia bacterium]|nr:two-component sensor histidine kinase [Clostridia bacterium]
MKKKLNLQFITVGVLTLILTFCLMLHIFSSSIINGAVDGLKRETDISVTLLENRGDVGVLDMFKNTEVRATLLSGEGIVLYESDELLQHELGCDFSEYPEIQSAQTEQLSMAERISDITGLQTYYCAKKLDDGRILRLATDINPAAMMLKKSIVPVLIVIAIILAMAVTASVLMSRHIIKWLTAKLETLENDPYANVPNELESVANAAREQYIKRRENERTRREFTANISHELKTPLTSISGYAEMIENGMARDEDIKQFAKNIHDESGRMITLIGDIIKLTEIDEIAETVSEEQFELLDLCEIAQEAVSSLEINAKRMDITVRFVGEHCTMRGDKSQLYEIVYNLCDNAIRYNKKGGFVTVSVRRDLDKAVLRVVDTGIGIPEEHRERIFERFFRVDKSHSRKTGGTGLGLAIVKHAALCHDAVITIKDGIECGTEIRVEFPVKTSAYNES